MTIQATVRGTDSECLPRSRFNTDQLVNSDQLATTPIECVVEDQNLEFGVSAGFQVLMFKSAPKHGANPASHIARDARIILVFMSPPYAG
jgi:hypothetical protein